MPTFLRQLLDRIVRRRRRPADPPRTGDAAAPPRVDIVLSELPRDWVASLEADGAATDYDVRSLGEPIDPARTR